MNPSTPSDKPTARLNDSPQTDPLTPHRRYSLLQLANSPACRLLDNLNAEKFSNLQGFEHSYVFLHMQRLEFDSRNLAVFKQLRNQAADQHSALSLLAPNGNFFAGILRNYLLPQGINNRCRKKYIKLFTSVKQTLTGHDEGELVPLLMSCVTNAPTILRGMLELPDVDVNQKSSVKEYTALTEAVFREDTASVRLLLTHKDIDVNHRQVSGMSTLYIACLSGNSSIVKDLLNHDDIDVNLATNEGATPLMLAAQEGHLACVLLLCARLETLEHMNTNSTVNQYF